MSRIRAVWVVAGLMAVSAGLPIAWACSCAPPPPPAEALKGSAAVFLGKVTDIQKAGVEMQVTLKVEKWWKGGDAGVIQVRTAMDSAACGFPFQNGGRYLVYAHAARVNAPLGVSLCSRTTDAQRAAEDLKAIGAGQDPKR